MNEFSDALLTALRLLAGLDPDLVGIVLLSLRVSVTAVLLAAAIGLPLGAALALARFPGRRVVIILVNSLMGLPPVVVGLVVYLLLSRSGPFGEFGLLFTPTAMIIAQCILVTPIVAALTRQTVADLHEEYDEHLRSLGATRLQEIGTLLWDGRFRLLTGILAGFGRRGAHRRGQHPPFDAGDDHGDRPGDESRQPGPGPGSRHRAGAAGGRGERGRHGDRGCCAPPLWMTGIQPP